MGNSYANVVVRGPSEEAVIDLVHGLARRALVVRYDDALTFVYDEEAEKAEGVVESLALTLATRLDCPTLAALNHDNDVLMLWLYDGAGTEWRAAWGVAVDGDERPLSERAFVTEAERLFGLEPRPKAGGLPNRLLARIFTGVRHHRILDALGLPAKPSMLGYRYVQRGDLADKDPSRTVKRIP